VTDDELDEIFASLSAVLTDSRLAWIVAQVNEQIQVGEIVTRTFHRGEPEAVAALELSTKPTGSTLIGTEPYGAFERVNLLVSALRVALKDSADLEQGVGEFFADEPPLASHILSAPDREISGVEAVVIAGGDNPATATAQQVLPLLDELNRRIAE